MRTKFYIRSDTPEVTTRLAQIPGRVPRFRIWLVTSVMERNSERFEEATQSHAQALDPLVQHRPPGQVGAGRRLGKVVGEGQAEASSIHALPDSRSVHRTEAQDASPCLREAGAKNVLPLTSDFHTRRARSIFRQEVPNHACRAPATAKAEQGGAPWWRGRRWAKVNLDEWMRRSWWERIGGGRQKFRGLL